MDRGRMGARSGERTVPAFGARRQDSVAVATATHKQHWHWCVCMHGTMDTNMIQSFGTHAKTHKKITPVMTNA